MHRHLMIAASALIIILQLARNVSAQQYSQMPYELIEQLTQSYVRRAVDGRQNGNVTCPTILCPDVNWRVDLSTNIKFMQKPQPRLIPRSASTWLDGFELILDTQVAMTVTANVYIDINGPMKDISMSIPINKLVGVHMMAAIYLQPQIQIDPNSIKLWLTDDGGNVQVNGLAGDLRIMGAEIGTAIGLVFGGPLAGGLLGSIIGNSASDIAKRKIKSIIQRKSSEAINIATKKIAKEIYSNFVPHIKSINKNLSLLPSLIGQLLTENILINQDKSAIFLRLG